MSVVEFLTIGCSKQGTVPHDLNEVLRFVGVPKAYVRKIRAVQHKKQTVINLFGRRPFKFDLESLLLGVKTKDEDLLPSEESSNQGEVPLCISDLKLMLDELKNPDKYLAPGQKDLRFGNVFGRKKPGAGQAFEF